MIDEETYTIPAPVIDVIEGGMPAIHAFRQHDGRSAYDVAAAAGITEERMAILERGSDNATNAKLEAMSEVLDVPRDLLIDE
jgi:transcriptional regulator with XRE-family HTH domain